MNIQDLTRIQVMHKATGTMFRLLGFKSCCIQPEYEPTITEISLSEVAKPGNFHTIPAGEFDQFELKMPSA